MEPPSYQRNTKGMTMFHPCGHRKAGLSYELVELENVTWQNIFHGNSDSDRVVIGLRLWKMGLKGGK